MIDTYDLYRKFIGRVNTQQGGAVQPAGNFMDWVNDSVISLYEEKFMNWEKSQKVVDDLSRPFLVSRNVLVTDGVAAFPKDYGHYSSARYYVLDKKVIPKAGVKFQDSCGELIDTSKQKPAGISQEIWEIIQQQEGIEKFPSPKKPRQITIDKIPNAQWGGCLESRFAGPTETTPKMTQFDDGFHVAPASISIIVLDYLKTPTPAKFEYKMVPGDVLTGDGDYMEYDKGKSVPIEFSSLVINEILTLLEKHYAKYIREQFMYEASESERKVSV